MLVYKYRGDLSSSRRDLDSLINNQIFASRFEDLNDPFEGTCKDEVTTFLNQIRQVFKVDISELQQLIEKFKGYKHTFGIYSLSKTFKNELLWAHYANSHKGFCIEYDLDKLKDKHSWDCQEISVNYTPKPPILSYEDFKDKFNTGLQKLFGTKSLSWKYEEEIRLAFSSSSLKDYHPSALTGVYFGERMSDIDKELIKSSLVNRDVQFYQISKANDSYDLIAELVHTNQRNIPNRLPLNSYEIISTNHNRAVENFSVFYKGDKKDEESLKDFSKKFKIEYCTKNCNVSLFNNNCIGHLVNKYPLDKQEEELYNKHFLYYDYFEE